MKSSDYIRHLLLSIGTNLAMLALRLLRNILLARLLGPADRGLFALLSTLPELIGAVTSGGLNTAVGYQAARQHPMGLLLTLILLYGCLISALATLLGLQVLDVFAQELAITQQLAPFAGVLLLAVPLYVLKSTLLTLHNADGRVGTFNGLRLLESLTPLLLLLALLWMWPHAALNAALVSWIGSLALVVAVGLCLLARYHSIRLRWDPASHGELLRFGGRSHPDVLFQQVLMRADYLLIGLFLDSKALGYYAMATAAAELLFIVPEAVTTPLMKRLLQQGEGIERLTPLALRLTGTAMLAACLGMALIGEWLIVLLFGDAFRPAYPALLALLPGIFSLCYSSILRLDLLGKERPGSLSILAGGAAALNLLLALLLIPHWGIVGASVASSIAYSALALAMLLLYWRVSGVGIRQTLLILPSDLRLLRAQMGAAT